MDLGSQASFAQEFLGVTDSDQRPRCLLEFDLGHRKPFVRYSGAYWASIQWWRGLIE